MGAYAVFWKHYLQHGYHEQKLVHAGFSFNLTCPLLVVVMLCAPTVHEISAGELCYQMNEQGGRQDAVWLVVMKSPQKCLLNLKKSSLNGTRRKMNFKILMWLTYSILFLLESQVWLIYICSLYLCKYGK